MHCNTRAYCSCYIRVHSIYCRLINFIVEDSYNSTSTLSTLMVCRVAWQWNTHFGWFITAKFLSGRVYGFCSVHVVLYIIMRIKRVCFSKSNGYYSISLQLEIVPVNDAPSLSFLGGGIQEQYSYTEDDPAINIGANLTLTDIDDISIQSVSLYLTGKAYTLLSQNLHLPMEWMTHRHVH